MESEFQYQLKNGGACVTSIAATGAALVIPDTIDGYPVTELSDRLFSGREIEEIWLPKTLRRIGRYAFYNCEHLHRIHFYSTTVELGGGFLTGCRRIKELYVHMDKNGKSGLRDFVTEITEQLLVHCFYPQKDGEDREMARLIFPEYYDEAIENTPARLISFSIHGTGQRYRYCLQDHGIRYDMYDQQFEHEVTETSVAETAELALTRLMYPYELHEKAEKDYETYLKDNLYEVFRLNLGDPEKFFWLRDHFGGEIGDGKKIGKEELEKLIDEASGKKYREALSVLMDLHHQKTEKKKKKFEL